MKLNRPSVDLTVRVDNKSMEELQKVAEEIKVCFGAKNIFFHNEFPGTFEDLVVCPILISTSVLTYS